jgi:hypothetical protein
MNEEAIPPEACQCPWVVVTWDGPERALECTGCEGMFAGFDGPHSPDGEALWLGRTARFIMWHTKCAKLTSWERVVLRASAVGERMVAGRAYGLDELRALMAERREGAYWRMTKEEMGGLMGILRAHGHVWQAEGGWVSRL